MDNKAPRVSIGMPVYNGERFIREALDSILAQTFTDFEIIISDNASTDKTEEICREYAAHDDRIRYFRNDRNLGAAENFNRAFELSSGEYFKWAAHDDTLGKDYLLRCVDVLESMPSVVLCIPRMRYIDDHGVAMGDHTVCSIVGEPRPSVRFQKTIYMPNPYFGIMVYGCMRASALRQTRLYGRYFWWTHILLVEMSLVGEFVEIPEPLHFGRLHDDQSFRMMSWREQATWMSPAYKPRLLLLTRWGLVLERLVSIVRSSVSVSEKALCCFHLLVFMLKSLRRQIALWFWRIWAWISRNALLASRFTHIPLRFWSLARCLRSSGLLKLGDAIRTAATMSDEKLFFTMAQSVMERNDNATNKMMMSWLLDPIEARRLAAASAIGARLNENYERSNSRPPIESERRVYALLLRERLSVETSEKVLGVIVDSLAAHGSADDRAIFDEILNDRIDVLGDIAHDLRSRIDRHPDGLTARSCERSAQ